MAAEIIDGKKIADEVKKNIAKQIEGWKKKPGLATVLVGDNPASKVYVSRKNVTCKEYGFHSKEVTLPESVEQDELIKKIWELNEDNKIHGILVQLPLPSHIDENAVLNAISPAKDVDGLTPNSMGRLLAGQPSFIPCTPRGVLHLIKSTGIKLEGKHAVVVGRSNLVGKPTAVLLLNEGCTLTVCHSKTLNLAEETKKADVLVVAVGKPKLITGEMVKEGAIVIDVGITKNAEGKILGDVDFETVKEKASFITPVPGGVGPMTIAMLLQNTFEAAKMIEGLQ
ncbi:MAG TPA: bifunctional methylenetetrahydrofolate dehydrogenase/methenyltetrahydrofolate cyclohydrolase FolD [Candidatus Norongarragalinales archaeon]|nr:bifunctional methylenetetrahydrofolate dehydrogenase/methenyltetrahydrofolate cyclohydrolase FolD [Candidatus Norongarragalinales archaeon]